MASGLVERQETQIVQSWLTLDDFLPGFIASVLRLPFLQNPSLVLFSGRYNNAYTSSRFRRDRVDCDRPSFGPASSTGAQPTP